MPRVESEQSPIEPRPLAVANGKKLYLEHRREKRLEWAIYGGKRIIPDAEKIEKTTRTIAGLNEELLVGNGNDDAIVLNREIAASLLFVPPHLDKSDAGRQLARHYANNFLHPVIDTITPYVHKEFAAAASVAEERQVSDVQVYEQKDLYREVMKRTYGSPQEYAEVAVAAVSSYANLKDAAGQYILAQQGTEQVLALLGKGTPVDNAARIANEAVSIYRDSPYFSEDVEKFVNDFRELSYIGADSNVRRFWGHEGVEQVSGQVRGGMDFYKDVLADRGVTIDIDGESVQVTRKTKY
jgi:hypothetical protein